MVGKKALQAPEPLPTPGLKLLASFLSVTYLRQAAWPGIKALETVLVPSKLDSQWGGRTEEEPLRAASN